jgi:ABC-type transporter Mla subunit MlaD
MLAALGPTAADAKLLATSIDSRRHDLSELVHNVAVVTHAASQDRQLAQVIHAGNETVSVLASESEPLRSAMAQFPTTLSLARSTLLDLVPFTRQATPTLTALQPALDRLPAALHSIPPFANAAATALSTGIRPLVTAARPVAQQLQPITTRLLTAVPNLTGGFQALRYFVNELAYNPGGDDQGFLFWLDWMAHNIDTFTANSDAHGPIASVAVVSTCYGLQDIPNLQTILGLAGLCSK